MSKRTIIASAGAAVALAAGAGGAYAAGGFGGGSGPGDTGGPAIAVHVDFGGPPGPPGDGEVSVGIFSPAVASYLGLSESELRTQLEAGKTLAQIATAQGKSVSGLKDAIYAEAKSHLDQAVAVGKLTATDEQTMLADLKSHLDDIVNRTGPPGGVKAGVFGTAVASYLGLSETELRTQLEAGKTLAQIATAQGKSVSGLKDAIYAEAKSNLDQAAAAGKLTATDEQTMLADLKSHLDEIVNNSGPLRVEGQGGALSILATDVAGYLGLSETELRTQVESGKSLAQIATAQGKSVEGLKAAIVADAKSKLDQAVAAGKITAAQAKAMLDELTSHVDDLVNRAGPPHLQARAA